MKKFALILLAGAGVLAASQAFAADSLVGTDRYSQSDAAVQVRLICDEDGRCYRSRGSRRVVIQQGYGDSYNYEPRERYIERRGYYDDGPRVGVGIGAPGVGVDVGIGGYRDRW